MIRRLTKINAFREVSDFEESTRGIFTLDLYFFVVGLRLNIQSFERLNIQSFERLEVSREKRRICWSAILFICFQVQEKGIMGFMCFTLLQVSNYVTLCSVHARLYT